MLVTESLKNFVAFIEKKEKKRGGKGTKMEEGEH